MKQTLGKIRRACSDFDLITTGEKICVGVSGGKDSMLLLTAMARYRLFSPQSFTLAAVTIDMGFKNMDFDILKRYCDELGVELFIEKTRISEIVFEAREEKNPCALCANLRRGALHTCVEKAGAKKLALGHHADDLSETLMMSLLYEGRINTFKAKTYLDRRGITVIRPLVYMREKDITYAVNRLNIPVVKSTCPMDGFSAREDTKKLIHNLDKQIPGSELRIIKAASGYMKGLSSMGQEEDEINK